MAQPVCNNPAGGVCASRQLGFQWNNPRNISFPQWLPGITGSDSFVFFKWDCSIDPKNYQVIVEANDASGEPYRTLGPLRSNVHVPYVWFSPYSKIGVVPNSNNLPSFVGIMHRGNTYLIPSVNGQNGVFELEQFGKY